MFFPKPHAYTQFRGSRKGYPVVRRPFYTWHKPSILLCNQRSVSNAEIFSHAYKNLKLGTLVGMPTYGGVISTRTIRMDPPVASSRPERKVSRTPVGARARTGWRRVSPRSR